MVTEKHARRKGIRMEQDIVAEAWRKGYAAMRSPGSGAGASYPKPDVVIFYEKQIHVVQVKTTRKRTLYLSKKAFEDELRFTETLRKLGFDAKAWLYVRVFKTGCRRLEKWIPLNDGIKRVKVWVDGGAVRYEVH